ncbi:tRNA (cytidine(34)-2'-O)-methyltransferase [Dietzia sp. 179-F 9C3 NHS]|uniref:tRNA (cytidine(34)-2'-O)-methyltransferase n=1 Tax=Dietzia sp. 179-F 9C3 NHS TaxID=3374295 RepID=UPI003879F8A5
MTGVGVRVLFDRPCIPPNTGNAIRMSAGAGCELHLAGPLGFDLSERHLRRAGLDYHDLAHVVVHADLEAAFAALLPARMWAFTAGADLALHQVRFAAGDVLLFGPEPTGLASDVLWDERVTARVRIPLLPGRRSMNLSNAAAVAVYEAWRQQGFTGGS